jgi:hypothetical protein
MVDTSCWFDKWSGSLFSSLKEILLSPTRLWLLCALGGSEVLEGSSKKKKKGYVISCCVPDAVSWSTDLNLNTVPQNNQPKWFVFSSVNFVD